MQNFKINASFSIFIIFIVVIPLFKVLIVEPHKLNNNKATTRRPGNKFSPPLNPSCTSKVKQDLEHLNIMGFMLFGAVSAYFLYETTLNLTEYPCCNNCVFYHNLNNHAITKIR